jgi:hypothetical protein
VDLLKDALSGRDASCPDDDARCAPAWGWITYLGVICWNARVGAPAGVCQPGLPLEAALALVLQNPSADLATRD